MYIRELFIKNRIIIAILVSSVMLLTLLTSCGGNNKANENIKSYDSIVKEISVSPNTELIVWYTDEEDASFLSEAAEMFEEKYGIGITFEKKDNLEYLESVNAANQSGGEPDVFLLPHEQLKKANMAGLVKPVTLFEESFWKQHYPEIAYKSASLNDGAYGYPLYFDTYFMVYDSDVIEKAPSTFDEIMELSKEYEGEKDLDILTYPANDSYLNYFFIGSYARIFGDYGDNSGLFYVDNLNTRLALEYYQELNGGDFGFSKKNSKEAVEKAVMAKKTILAICKSSILSELDLNDSSYMVEALPDLTKELKTTGLSSTKLAVVNSAGKQDLQAELFASFISYEYAEQQYDLTGKLSARFGAVIENERLLSVYRQYTNSIAVPKTLEMGDFWSYFAITMDNIQKGKEVENELRLLQEKMQKRIG